MGQSPDVCTTDKVRSPNGGEVGPGCGAAPNSLPDAVRSAGGQLPAESCLPIAACRAPRTPHATSRRQDGCTLLHMVCKSVMLSPAAAVGLAKLLLDAGANTKAKDTEGRCCWEYASGSELRVLLGGSDAAVAEASSGEHQHEHHHHQQQQSLSEPADAKSGPSKKELVGGSRCDSELITLGRGRAACPVRANASIAASMEVASMLGIAWIVCESAAPAQPGPLTPPLDRPSRARCRRVLQPAASPSPFRTRVHPSQAWTPSSTRRRCASTPAKSRRAGSWAPTCLSERPAGSSRRRRAPAPGPRDRPQVSPWQQAQTQRPVTCHATHASFLRERGTPPARAPYKGPSTSMTLLTGPCRVPGPSASIAPTRSHPGTLSLPLPWPSRSSGPFKAAETARP
jgi:hypothetical protein